MTRTWTDKAVNEQRDLNRWVDALSRQPGFLAQGSPLNPRIVVTQEQIAVGGSGRCAFMEGSTFGSLQASSQKATMHNLVIDDVIKAGERCLALQSGAIGSGEDGWVLVRVVTGTTSTTTGKTCGICPQGSMSFPLTLVVAGLADSTTTAGTAAQLNGTHSLKNAEEEAFFGLLTTCQGAKSITDTVNGGKLFIRAGVDQSNRWFVEFAHSDSYSVAPSVNIHTFHSLGTTKIGVKPDCTVGKSGDINVAWAEQLRSGATAEFDTSSLNLDLSPPN